MNSLGYWGVFTVLTFGAFITHEVYAIRAGKQTYTSWIREKLGISPARPWGARAAVAFALAMIAFTVWFVPHITLGWWGGDS